MNNIILDKKVSEDDKNNSDMLLSKLDTINDNNIKRNMLKNIIEVNPYNSNALIQLAILEFGINSNLAFILLEKAFSNDVLPIQKLNNYKLIYLMGLLARYKIQNMEYNSAEVYLSKIIKEKNNFPTIAQEIQLATLITGYPYSINDAKNIIINIENRINNLLKLDKIDISYVNDNDPYLFCMLSFFNLEIYHECNIKSLMNKYYKLMIKVFPELIYTSPHLKENKKQIINKKIENICHIGIISAFFSDNSSVLLDFKGVINNLPNNKYKITFIYINESNKESNYLKTKKNVLIYFKKNKWLEKCRKDIGELNLDILFYLDSTMSTMIQKLLISKLSNIQILSHGHPITSGIDNNIVNYYISWEGAELEYDKAQEHYTEKLILIPKTTIHQYYLPVTSNNKSLFNNISYENITRDDFKEFIESSGNWYLCMQKPFKRHPEFDYILKDILNKDPEGKIILHGDTPYHNKIIIDRLKNINTDITRIYLIPVQPHHRLIALYKVSDVILDSYYAGGCTTTREALEVGGIVVTLPTNYLGGRWSYGYYNIIGVDDMIAKTKDEYINISVKIATNKKYNIIMKNKILDNVNKLFFQKSAINAWDTIFQDILKL